MNDSGLMIGAATLMTSLLALLGIIFHLMRRVSKLEQTLNSLESQLESGSHDVAGLCSAALVVDRRLAHQEALLHDLQKTVDLGPATSNTTRTPEIINEPEEEPTAEGYDKAIQLIRRGANVETLVKSCGVTRDEAMLLLRLHGNR